MTPLKQGKKLARVVPSRSHDARKTRRMVVEIDHTGLLPEIRLRPESKRNGVSITIDGCYELMPKATSGDSRRPSAPRIATDSHRASPGVNCRRASSARCEP